MLLVFCQKITPRVQYTFKHVFTTALGVEIDFTSKLETFIAYNGPKMSYGKAPLGNEFFIEASPLLFEFGVQDISIKMKEWKTYPCFFEVGNTSAIPFDLFAATFYLISRYEEYLPHVKDALNRFEINQSLCVRKGFAQVPLVDIWLAELLLILRDVFPELSIEETSGEKFMPLVEVVSPFKYLHQSIFSNLATFGKALYRLNFWELFEQPMVLLGFRKDPWDTFQEFKTLFYQSKFKSRFFFLFSKGSDMDRGISTRNATFQSLIKEVADYFEVGLLASFPANKKSKQFKKERKDLKLLIHRGIQKIRYAWGISTVNESYRNLLMQEVEADYSFGFPSIMGYRASTAVPFFYYDLANEMTTSLKIFPVVANVNSLRQYDPVEGIKKLSTMGKNLPLSRAVHCFAISNQIIENSELNKGYRSVIIDYLKAHD
jgi:hypothetical protein